MNCNEDSCIYNDEIKKISHNILKSFETILCELQFEENMPEEIFKAL